MDTHPIAPLMAPGNWCYWVSETQFDDEGFIPSVVVFADDGHWPLTGRTAGQRPWHWGRSFDEARQVCERANASLGLSPERVQEIVASSMAAHFASARRRPRDGSRERDEASWG